MKLKKCKYESVQEFKTPPIEIWIRCRYPGIKGTFNCIGYENCADYEEIKYESDNS